MKVRLLLESQKGKKKSENKNRRRGRRRQLKWNNAFNEIAVGVDSSAFILYMWCAT
jgi:hypothetical protein